MSLQSFPIFAPKSGLKTNTKPVFLPDDAWSRLDNAYIYRDRVLKREGIKLLGRLRRNFININIGINPGATSSGNILSITGYPINISNAVNAIVTTYSPHRLVNGNLVIFSNVSGMTNINGLSAVVTVIDAYHFSVAIDSSGFPAYTSGGFFFSNRQIGPFEPNAEVEPGSVVYIIHAGPDIVFTDQGDGTLTSPTAGNSGTINYATGAITITTTAAPLILASGSVSYYPTLPVMGIPTRDLSALNNEQTIWFDTTYAYVWDGSDFVEFIPGTTWNSSDSDFFWGYNYRGAVDNNRLFFETNFISTTDNPMRYTDGNTWTTFSPLITATDTLFTARILVAYYGRLLALNTFEGTTAGGAGGAVNFFNRCRFSQLGSPIAADAFRSDQFGKGGFLDAPTNEAIVGAMFIKNTLIVEFEQSSWQLRYVGEYGFPFVWERVSADFGSESTFSSVLFDNHMLAVGDKAIVAVNGIGADRIDLDIPDQIFNFKNANNGVKRVFGIRNYQKEIVYWNYADAQTSSSVIFPNKVLLYNYRNNTWAIFRDNVTAFGNFQYSNNLTWDSLSVIWDSDDVTWDDAENQSLFPAIVSGNQEGFIHLYQEDRGEGSGFLLQEEPSLSIRGVDLTVTPISMTVSNHNLADGEIIYITGLMFIITATGVPVATNLNDKFYRVAVVDANTIQIFRWNTTNQQYDANFSFTPVGSTSTYIGGGRITILPKLDVITKDINVYQTNSMQTKLSRLDFLMQPSVQSAMTVNLVLNSSPVVSGNLLVGNKEMSTVQTAPFYTPSSEYSWFRFYATLAAQYFRVQLTYDDDLMNTVSTHTDSWTMYAMNAWCRAGGKNVF